MFYLLTAIWYLLFTYHFLFSKRAIKKTSTEGNQQVDNRVWKGGSLTQMVTSIIRHINIKDNCGIDIVLWLLPTSHLGL